MDILLASVCAFTVSLVVTPLVIRLAYKFGYLDYPNRSHPAILHSKPLPRAGGVPPLIGFVAALFFTAAVSSSFGLSKALMGIIIASIFLVVVGLLDDKFDLNPYLRLFTNFVAVAIAVGAGIGIVAFTNPFGGLFFLDRLVLTINLPTIFGFLSGTHHIIVLADLIAALWIVWVMNALNWSSGVDGQLSGIATISLAILGVAALQLTFRDPSQAPAAVIAFAAAAAFGGFLPWSFYPQKIMPGYGGSTLAGFLIAVLAILSGAKLATALMVLLIPLVDSFWTVVRRLAARRSPVWGDRLHLHHQLLNMGWSPPQICLLYYLIGLVLGILALGFDSQGKFFALAIFGTIAFAALFTSYTLLRRFNIG